MVVRRRRGRLWQIFCLIKGMAAFTLSSTFVFAHIVSPHKKALMFEAYLYHSVVAGV